MTRPSISIIGPGKVGIALARLARSAGYRVVALAGRDLARTEAAAAEIDPEICALGPTEAARACELLFLTVPDSSIAGVARQLLDAAALKEDSVLVHCSGALTSEVLANAQRDREQNQQVAVASFHPLQTFPTVHSAESNLPGSHCFLEGDERALEVLEAFGAAIGTHCVRIETRAKVLYHAGAVIACNYLCALMDAALTATDAAAIDRRTARSALRPLVEATLDNIAKLGPEAALTGPIQRGDHETVSMHLRALGEAVPELKTLYQELGCWTLDLATRSGQPDRGSIETLRRALESTSE